MAERVDRCGTDESWSAALKRYPELLLQQLPSAAIFSAHKSKRGFCDERKNAQKRVRRPAHSVQATVRLCLAFRLLASTLTHSFGTFKTVMFSVRYNKKLKPCHILSERPYTSTKYIRGRDS